MLGLKAGYKKKKSFGHLQRKAAAWIHVIANKYQCNKVLRRGKKKTISKNVLNHSCSIKTVRYVTYKIKSLQPCEAVVDGAFS